MISKKLATLLTLGVMLGQTGLLSTLFAQAETQIPTPQSLQDSLQVASVIDTTDTVIDADDIQAPAPPDVYTIDMGENQSPVVIEIKAETEKEAVLFVNGFEAMHFRNDIDAYGKAKAVAEKLNGVLMLDVTGAADIKPAMKNKQPVIQVGEEILLTLDGKTAKSLKMDAGNLALVWSNRLRQALGEKTLDAKDFPELKLNQAAKTAAAKENYKSTGRVQTGMASWYGPGFHGRRTASGSRFNQYALTAAHRTLPFGTVVRVVNQRNKRSCIVRINDRGPYAHGRIIDLSKGAASAIGMSGVANVKLEVVKRN